MEKKCPYCSKPMEIGYIYNKKNLVWTPENLKPHPIVNMTRKGEITITKAEFTVTRTKVYRCPDCKIDIIYEEES